MTNSYAGWSVGEDQQLDDEYRAEESICEIEIIHHKSYGSISARLKKWLSDEMIL